MKFTEATSQAARKRHRCEWCWQFIEVSEQYKRYRWFDGREAGTTKMHPECFAAMQTAAEEDGGYTEWTPGMERPVIDQPTAKEST